MATLRDKPQWGREGYRERALIAYKGYEFTPQEFIKKYPKYKYKKRRKKR